MTREIATVDLAKGQEVAARQLHAAFAQTGFAYVVNHGVSNSLLQELTDLSRQFFARPAEEKNKIAMRHAGHAWRGFFPAGAEFTAGVPDQKEGLYFGAEHPDTHPGVRQGWPMHGRNLWPAGEELTRFPDVVTEYMAQMTALGHRLMALVATGLGLKVDYFKRRFTADPTTLFRIFNYPKQPRGSESWGVGAHTDMGFLTILLQDNLGGLQVLHRDGSWIDAPPVEGAFVINIGDMLQHWTHGIYKATLHRVKNTAGKDRLSFPFFFDPHWHCRLAAIDRALLDPQLLSAAERDPHRQRWDGLDMSSLSNNQTYGDFVWAKIQHVFPELARSGRK